jgi:MinD-like ATPase involved in chromosome partitioning or flagellar assembly
VDLPTYTSIWRIEKRLYKLYDFRLPMPLPIGQITVFAAIAVPYVVLLTVLGLPFSHSLIWLYVLPPGVATWLVTRPVLEAKRLPELLASQLRYLAEPRIWCRMSPLSEADVITVTGRVWRLSAVGPAGPVRRVVAPGPQETAAVTRAASPAARAVAPADAGPPPRVRAQWPDVAASPPTQPRVQVRQPASAPLASPQPPHPVVTVVASGSAYDTPPTVERALAGPSQRLGDGRTGRVTVVPGGHRPGKPDQLQRDRARAQQPVGAHRRVIVLGCTVGAGQTVTTLLIGEVLASLRSDQIAVLDLNPGSGSLVRRALQRPALGQAASLSPSRLTVLADHGAEPGGEDEPGQIDPASAVGAFERVGAAHQIVLADPSTSAVIRLLAVADQLVLVAPASSTAARAIGMTFEWLDAHGRADLAADAIMVMNGVSRRTMSHVEQAERVCIGRCRAIVRVPWDDQLKTQVAKPRSSSAPSRSVGQQWAGLLSPATVSACTALAGVLVTALADRGRAVVSTGQVSR